MKMKKIRKKVQKRLKDMEKLKKKENMKVKKINTF